jgi:hypothetical protein
LRFHNSSCLLVLYTFQFGSYSSDYQTTRHHNLEDGHVQFSNEFFICSVHENAATDSNHTAANADFDVTTLTRDLCNRTCVKTVLYTVTCLLHPTTGKILPNHYQTTAKPLPNYYQTTTKPPPNHYQTTTKLLPNHRQTTTKPLPNHRQTTTKPLPPL